MCCDVIQTFENNERNSFRREKYIKKKIVNEGANYKFTCRIKYLLKYKYLCYSKLSSLIAKYNFFKKKKKRVISKQRNSKRKVLFKAPTSLCFLTHLPINLLSKIA